MKNLILIFAASLLWSGLTAQIMDEAIEKRAREMHRVISLDDKAQWEKFVKENYTQALIERTMKAQIKKDGPEGASSQTQENKGTVADKVNMLQRLHNDFGGSKISSLKTKDGEVEMVISGSGLSGTFRLKFDKNAPYLIDRIGIQVEGGGN